MRTRKIPKWVCGAVLCCAVPAAFCQTLSGSLAEGTGLSADASQGGSGMGSIEGRSQVSASASSTMNTDVKASMDAEDVSGAVVDGGTSGAGAGSARLDFRISPSADKPVNGRLEFGLAGERSPELKRKEVSGHAAISSARTNLRNGTMQAGQRLNGRVSRARNGSANHLAATTARQSGAAYSKDFPDSTKGTALLSPPDSTGSPLDWTPSLNYGFPDFMEQPFLEPSLRGGHSVRKRRIAARTKSPVMGGIPSDALTYPDLSTSLGNSLRVRVPDPLADLASH